MYSKKGNKKEYSTPELTVHGEAKKLTWGPSGAKSDGHSGSGRPS